METALSILFYIEEENPIYEEVSFIDVLSSIDYGTVDNNA